MKRLLLCLLTATLLSGCFDDGSETMTAIAYSRQGDNELRHFRPVHRLHAQWSMEESGKTLTVKTDGNHIRLSVRQNPPRIIVRQAGSIIGTIEKTDEGAKFTPVGQSAANHVIFCRESHRVNISSGSHQAAFTFDDKGMASSSTLQVQSINHHRYSIAEVQPAKAQNEACKGTELESPFSALGTLIFHDDEMDLAIRSGFAWFVTKIDSDCLR